MLGLFRFIRTCRENFGSRLTVVLYVPVHNMIKTVLEGGPSHGKNWSTKIDEK